MKKFIKWLGIICLLILVILCIDMNFSRSKISPIGENQMRVLNLITVTILLILIIWIAIVRRLNKKKE